MPHPITFLIAVIVAATGAIVFVLLTPEARLWVERFPTEVSVVVGASTGAIVVLLTIALAGARRRRRVRDDWATARNGEARTLAAALKGEMTALGQWLAAQADALETSTPGNPSRSNLDTLDLDVPSMAARIVYQSNATRLALLGPDLAAAIAYCHASFERCESERTAPGNGGAGSEIALLRAIEGKFELTTGYLESFIAGKPAVIGASDRKTLFAPIEPV